MMKKIALLTVLWTTITVASINIDATYSTLGFIAKQVGKQNVKVTILGSPKYDPHFIVPKPSLLSKLRRADLLIINGGGLELGWLPPLISNSNNGKIKDGAVGFLDISHFISMIDIPTSVSRAFGDIHSQGNPHYFTNPHIVPIIAKAIGQKLIQIDPIHKVEYQTNLTNFINKWQNYLKKYDKNMQMCPTKEVVQYHELFNYFLEQYGIKKLGNIEPLPGIAPSSKHTIELINTIKRNGVKKILQDVYHERKSAKFISSKTDAKVVVLPHDLGADGSKTLQEFYNNIANKICK